MCTQRCWHIPTHEFPQYMIGNKWRLYSVQSISASQPFALSETQEPPSISKSKFKNYPLRKKSSRKRGGSRKGRGWVHGSELVNDSVPIVLSPRAFALAKLVREESSREVIWKILDMSSPTHDYWDDIINVVVQLKRERNWSHAIEMCEWILQTQKFRPDILCYNLLMDSYGRNNQYLESERVFKLMRESRFLANEDTFNVLIRAYSTAGMIDKAEAMFSIMQKFGYKTGVATFNTLLEAFAKAGKVDKAEMVYQKMEKFNIVPTANTFTQMINIYGKKDLEADLPPGWVWTTEWTIDKAGYVDGDGWAYGPDFQSIRWPPISTRNLQKAEKIFFSMATVKCIPNICTYTALMQAYAKKGLCIKAEEVFEALQAAGYDPDVYSYNALLEAYSRAGFPFAAVEVLNTMQQMNCEPDRASFDILIDAFGQAGLVDDAKRWFYQMKTAGFTPTLRSHMVLLCALSKVGRVEEAEGIVLELQRAGIKPDTFVFNSLLHAYGNAGKYTQMDELFKVMEQGLCKTDISTYNTVVNSYAKAGYIDKVEEIFTHMARQKISPDVCTWTSLIGAYAKKGQYKRCISLYRDMIFSGCRRDEVVDKVLLSSFSKLEDAEDALEELDTLYKEVLKSNANPTALSLTL